MDNFYEIIKQITKNTPNDTELGNKIRRLFWQIDEDNSKNLNT